MAITKTEVIRRCEVYPAMDVEDPPTDNDANPTVVYVSQITFDDADDADGADDAEEDEEEDADVSEEVVEEKEELQERFKKLANIIKG